MRILRSMLPLAASFLLAGPPLVAQTTINFDDLTTTQFDPIPVGYAGLTWSNDFYYLYSPAYNGLGLGYEYGMVSSPNVAFNGFGYPVDFSSATPFTLTSAYFTSLRFGYIPLLVQGYLGGAQVFSQDLTLSVSSPQLVNFGYTVDKVTFQTTNEEVFVMDNLVINGPITTVPEPATMLLVGTGLAAVAGWRKRRRE